MGEEFRLVFASDKGRMCPDCGRPKTEYCCGAKKQPAGDGIARVRRESKGRKGKTVTTITGLLLEEDELRRLAGEFKKRCGSGGSVKDGVIVLQGDHCDLIMQELARRAIHARRAGG